MEEGPIKIIDPERVPKEPRPLYEGFEWVTMDLTDEKEVCFCRDSCLSKVLIMLQLEEVYELLAGHYVEDGEAMFRFNYSFSFLNWYGSPF